VKNKALGIPVDLLNRVNEHTSGGFMLFFVNEKGDPDYLTHVDNSIIERGLMSFIEDTVESIRAIEKDARINALIIDDDDDDET